MFIIQLLIVLLALYVGARYGTLALGVPGYVLLGVLPSVYGYFFIPNYPSDIATVNFDRSDTTKIGEWLLNHSFMMPGLVSVCLSTLAGLLLSTLIYG